MTLKRSSFGLAILFVAGCGDFSNDFEQKQSELVYGKQYVMVPAYFNAQFDNDDFYTLSDWANHNSNGAIKFVVVNLGCEWLASWNPQDRMGACQPDANGHRVAGGPGSQVDPDESAKQTAIAEKIGRFHASGISVYAYVDFYANRPSTNIVADISAWRTFGTNTGQWVDGIFYDDADRSSSLGLARAAFWTGYVFRFVHPQGNNSLVGSVVFNYGTTHTWTGNFVGCLARYRGMFNRFVTHEHDMATFNQIDVWGEFNPGGNAAWMNGYMPDHFVNIVHDIPTNVTLSTIQDLTNRSRILNAGSLYLTNGPVFPPPKDVDNGNTYGHLAQNSVLNPGTFPLFDYLDGDSAGDTAEYAHGGTSDPPAGSCPAENANAPE